MKQPNAQLECTFCKYKWEDAPGALGASAFYGCPSCGHYYFHWTNYHEFIQSIKASSPGPKSGRKQKR